MTQKKSYCRIMLNNYKRQPEVASLKENRTITIMVGKEEIVLDIHAILYVVMNRNNAEIHALKEKIYITRMTMIELQEKLGEEFLLVHRSVLVSARAIHSIEDKIYLSNGEALDYVLRKKKFLREQLLEKQKRIIGSFHTADIPRTREEYADYYRSFDYLPFAFTDIEMVFNEENSAVDWIFCYGNEALAKLEKLPLERMIGASFGSLFANMDSKWLRSYERATLYGETREIIDYSPEIDTYLKVICFPTFKGHCGCILFDVTEIFFDRTKDSVENAMLMLLGKLPNR